MKYYLHDSNSFDDEKIAELFLKFGYEGLGLFYTLLEKIAKQEKPIKTEVLKHQLKVGKKLEKCWKFMESLGLICSNNGETFNKKVLNVAEIYQEKKEKNAKRVSEWREKQELTENVTDYEQKSNNDVTPTSKDKLIKDKIIKYVEDDFTAAKMLYSLILENDPKAKEPNLEKWASEINQIHRLDGREYDDIFQVIEWCQKDSFWKTNILSAGKLRKQFARLFLQMNERRVDLPEKGRIVLAL